MNDDSSNRTVLFIDLTDSTGLYERLGDAKALEYSSAALTCWEEIVESTQGRVVKRIGDELMCVFDGAEDAARAAMDIQIALDNRLEGVEIDLRAKAGFHTGPLIEDNGDVFGDTVNLAARIVALAQPGQILTTAKTAVCLPPFFATRMHPMGSTAVKGKSGSYGIFELVWKAAQQTKFIEIPLPAGAEQRMAVRHGDNHYMIDSQNSTLRIGRFDHNELIMNREMVSRSHCRIEYRRCRFVLVDESRNGTWLHSGDGSARHVCQNEVTLPRAGYLALGTPLEGTDPNCIHFAVETQEVQEA